MCLKQQLWCIVVQSHYYYVSLWEYQLFFKSWFNVGSWLIPFFFLQRESCDTPGITEPEYANTERMHAHSRRTTTKRCPPWPGEIRTVRLSNVVSDMYLLLTKMCILLTMIEHRDHLNLHTFPCESPLISRPCACACLLPTEQRWLWRGGRNAVSECVI